MCYKVVRVYYCKGRELLSSKSDGGAIQAKLDDGLDREEDEGSEMLQRLALEM